MAVTLTPAQQASLDEFEQAAKDATDAAVATVDSDAALAAADIQAARDKQAALDTHVSALAKATTFIGLMVPELPAKNLSTK